MRRRLLISGVVAALLAVGIPGVSQVQAAPRAGQVCAKVGATSGALVCKRVKGKPVWKKRATPVRQPAVTPTPVPTPTPTPTPPPLSESAVTPLGDLKNIGECKLQDRSGNLFHLGFPVSPVLPQMSQIRVFAIPVEFADTDRDRLSTSETSLLFSTMSEYFTKESYGRNAVEFIFPPVDTATARPTAITLNERGDRSNFVSGSGFVDFKPLISEVLGKTPVSWNLSSYDSVAIYFQDTRTRNRVGGQAWRGVPGGNFDQVPFTSPSGPVRSLVVTSALTAVFTHELAHSLFGFIDLYDAETAGQKYVKGWGLLSAGYRAEYGLRGWEKWIIGAHTDSEVRCTGTSTTHFLNFQHARPNGKPYLIVVPLDSTRAVVVEAITVNEVSREFGFRMTSCGADSECSRPGARGLLAYLLDVSKLSGLGPIRVPEALTFPSLVNEGQSISLEGIRIVNKACDALGCRVDVARD